MTKARHSKDAADAFRLLRLFRSLDPAIRRRVVEIVEAMAAKEGPADDKAAGRRPKS
ncbi:hypothetical protein [Bradyrhizobium tropiciagri]|uniref:hypothetical protein n=1 Tax=Bradyrhizobium tropiciagri TaxID=312253 RepID=UPI000B31B9E8|nr:hypothetical protein [Bradyrhizobium tropiciagri]